jgi:hypothetical protein
MLRTSVAAGITVAARFTNAVLQIARAGVKSRDPAQRRKNTHDTEVFRTSPQAALQRTRTHRYRRPVLRHLGEETRAGRSNQVGRRGLIRAVC